MNRVFAILSGLLLVSCVRNAPEMPKVPVITGPLPVDAVLVGRTKADTAELVVRLAESFTPVAAKAPSTLHESKIVKTPAGWFLERRGAPGPDCALDRLSLVSRDDGLYAVPGTSVRQSCTGQNCQQCEFQDDGWGCICNQPISGSGASLCNHSISDDIAPAGVIAAPLAP